MTNETTKAIDFDTLVREAKSCVLCPRMKNSARVIGPASGFLNAPILIIGEAPGRLGADASAIPFHGDKAGDNFETLLEQVGLTRHVCFVTNAALCNPRDENGNNATPTRSELQNCSTFLRRQIEVIDPKIIVTLGAQALNALKLIEHHDISLAGGVRKAFQWKNRLLLPLYHPGQRAMIHRSFLNQLADYRFLAETFLKLGKKPGRLSAKPTSALATEVAKVILKARPSLSYFALHKLFYLAEYEHYRRIQRRMTTSYIIRQKDGPYVVELQIKRLKKALESLKIKTQNDQLSLGLNEETAASDTNDTLDIDTKKTLSFVMEKYGNLSESELKRVVYLTSPMREILRREKRLKVDMFNSPIDFSASAPKSLVIR